MKFIEKHTTTIAIVLIILLVSGVFVLIFEKKYMNKLFPQTIETDNKEILDKIAALEARLERLENPSSNIVASTSTVQGDLININTADAKELDKLPGIGEVKSKAIVDYRDKNGAFGKKEDLLKVSGISQSVYEKLKDLVTI